MRFSNKKEKRYCNENGYVLLLSVVISGIVLSIGVGITNLTLKGLVFAAAGRDSQFAFYASDSGSECALYWDIKPRGFNNTVFATSSASRAISSGVECAGSDIATTWTVFDQDENSAKTRFTVNYPNGRCSIVLVSKTNSGTNTVIESRGYNTCDTTFSRRLERGAKISY